MNFFNKKFKEDYCTKEDFLKIEEKNQTINNLYDYTYQSLKDIPLNNIASEILKGHQEIKQSQKTKSKRIKNRRTN